MPSTRHRRDFSGPFYTPPKRSSRGVYKSQAVCRSFGIVFQTITLLFLIQLSSNFNTSFMGISVKFDYRMDSCYSFRVMSLEMVKNRKKCVTIITFPSFTVYRFGRGYLSSTVTALVVVSASRYSIDLILLILPPHFPPHSSSSRVYRYRNRRGYYKRTITLRRSHAFHGKRYVPVLDKRRP